MMSITLPTRVSPGHPNHTMLFSPNLTVPQRRPGQFHRMSGDIELRCDTRVTYAKLKTRIAFPSFRDRAALLCRVKFELYVF